MDAASWMNIRRLRALPERGATYAEISCDSRDCQLISRCEASVIWERLIAEHGLAHSCQRMKVIWPVARPRIVAELQGAGSRRRLQPKGTYLHPLARAPSIWSGHQCV